MSFRFNGSTDSEKSQLMCDWIRQNDKRKYTKPENLFYPPGSYYPPSLSFVNRNAIIAEPIADIPNPKFQSGASNGN